MIAFIDDHRETYGVEPICRVLPIAPSTYHAHVARRADPNRLPARAKRDAVLMAEIRYAEETTGGILRHASFLGLREDKMPPTPPGPVIRVEKPSGRSLKIAGVTVTSADRVVFPEAGVTKGDLAAYYERLIGG